MSDILKTKSWIINLFINDPSPKIIKDPISGSIVDHTWVRIGLDRPRFGIILYYRCKKCLSELALGYSKIKSVKMISFTNNSCKTLSENRDLIPEVPPGHDWVEKQAVNAVSHTCTKCHMDICCNLYDTVPSWEYSGFLKNGHAYVSCEKHISLLQDIKDSLQPLPKGHNWEDDVKHEAIVDEITELKNNFKDSYDVICKICTRCNIQIFNIIHLNEWHSYSFSDKDQKLIYKLSCEDFVNMSNMEEALG